MTNILLGLILIVMCFIAFMLFIIINQKQVSKRLKPGLDLYPYFDTHNLDLIIISPKSNNKV